jgi:hypothetical protein
VLNRSVASTIVAGMDQRLLAGDSAVESSERGRVTAAGRGQRLEFQRGEQPCRASVPGVREQQRRLLLMQGEELFGCLSLAGQDTAT